MLAGDFCGTGEVVYCGEEVAVLGVERADLVKDFAGEKHRCWVVTTGTEFLKVLTAVVVVAKF